MKEPTKFAQGPGLLWKSLKAWTCCVRATMSSCSTRWLSELRERGMRTGCQTDSSCTSAATQAGFSGRRHDRRRGFHRPRILHCVAYIQLWDECAKSKNPHTQHHLPGGVTNFADDLIHCEFIIGEWVGRFFLLFFSFWAPSYWRPIKRDGPLVILFSPSSIVHDDMGSSFSSSIDSLHSNRHPAPLPVSNSHKRRTTNHRQAERPTVSNPVCGNTKQTSARS